MASQSSENRETEESFKTPTGSGLDEDIQESTPRQTGVTDEYSNEESGDNRSSQKEHSQQQQLDPKEPNPDPSQQEPDPNQQQSDPNQQPDPNQQQPNPSQEQIDLKQPDPIQKQPDPNQQQSDSSQQQPDPNQHQPNPSQEQTDSKQPDPIQKQPDPNQQQSDSSQQQPDPNQQQPNPSQEQTDSKQPDPIQQQSDPNQQQTDPNQEQPDSSQQQSDPNQQQPDPNQEQSDSSQQQPGPSQQHSDSNQPQLDPTQSKTSPRKQKPDPSQSQLNPKRKSKPSTSQESMTSTSRPRIDPDRPVFRRHSNLTAFEPFKVIVMGDIGAGKTSIIRRYVREEFFPEYSATIGVDFLVKDVQYEEHRVKLHIWDIAGEERSQYMTRALFRVAHGAFIVHDATKIHTFRRLVKWKNIMEDYLTEPDGTKVPTFVLSNKVDLLPSKKVEDYKISEGLLRTYGFSEWHQTSAKENINIDKAFYNLLRVMVENRITNFRIKRTEEETKFSINDPTASIRKCIC